MEYQMLHFSIRFVCLLVTAFCTVGCFSSRLVPKWAKVLMSAGCLYLVIATLLAVFGIV